MSWTSRFGNLGRFSPFSRPQGSTKVSDADFSYITADDLRKHQAESQQSSSDAQTDLGNPRDTDVLVMRNKKQEYPIHFPAYSIAKEELTIGSVREQAAKKIGSGDPRRVKLLYKGRNLKDDTRTCKQEGLHDRAELMCTIAERAPSTSDSDDDDDDDLAEGMDDSRDGETKRRRNRGKKTKRRNRREATTSTPQLTEPSLSHQASRAQSPKPPALPTTPLDKLNALHEKLQSFNPEVRAFQASPPADPGKREFEHKRLSETILTQVLLKLDAVETEGDADARARRRELVNETQQVLQELDAAK